jgi:hypothetical protein
MKIDLFDVQVKGFVDKPICQLRQGERIVIRAADVEEGNMRHLQLDTSPGYDSACVVVSAPIPLRQEVENKEVSNG